jgi:hypothetical protein
MPLQQVHLRINDAATGKPTPVRVRITDADGNYHAPFGRLTDFATGPNQDVGGNVMIGMKKWAYIDGACEILLPPGELHFEIAKGPEFKPINETVTLLPGKMAMRFTIERWCNVREQGWYSGDTRVHYLSPDAALLEGQAEDLAVVNLLTRETTIRDSLDTLHRSIPNVLSFSGQAFARHAGGCGVALNTLNYRVLNHPVSLDLATLGLLHCHRIVYPLVLEANDDNWTTEDWCDQCHRKNGLVVSAYTGASTDFRSWESLATLMLGKVDALEVWPVDRVNWRLRLGSIFGSYYDLFDMDMLLPLVGASCKRSNGGEIGSMRTFAFIPLNQEFSYTNWIEAVRAGRTFVSTGPLLDFTIDGKVPMHTYNMPVIADKLQIRVEAKSAVRYDRLELLWNGNVIRSVTADISSPHRAELEHDLAVQESGWLAVRCVTEEAAGLPDCCPLAHSSPVAIRLANSPSWARQDSVRALLAQFDDMIAWTRTRTHPARPRLIGLYEKARTVFAKKLS